MALEEHNSEVQLKILFEEKYRYKNEDQSSEVYHSTFILMKSEFWISEKDFDSLRKVDSVIRYKINLI